MQVVGFAVVELDALILGEVAPRFRAEARVACAEPGRSQHAAIEFKDDLFARHRFACWFIHRHVEATEGMRAAVSEFNARIRSFDGERGGGHEARQSCRESGDEGAASVRVAATSERVRPAEAFTRRGVVGFG